MGVSAVSNSMLRVLTAALLLSSVFILAGVAGTVTADSEYPAANTAAESSPGNGGEATALATALAHNLPRVVSINLCTDQLVMALASTEQVVALSSLSHDKAGSFYHEKARGFLRVEAAAEQLLPLAPDLVLSGPYTSRYTLNLLAELGLRVEALPIANNIDDMVSNVKRVGELLGREVEAASVVKGITEKLADIAARVEALDADVSPRVAVYDTNGYTVGSNTVRGQAIELSGWQNVASEKGIENYGVLGLEQLIELAPQALLDSPYSEGTYSRGQMLTRHPAIRAAGLDPLIIRVPSNQTICAGPWTVDVVEQLLEARELL